MNLELLDCEVNGGQFFGKTQKCYVLSSDKASWSQGRLNCQKQKNGDLASIPNEETMNFIKQNINFITSTWFGGKKESEGNWYWVDGSVWSYTQWTSGEPNVVGEAYAYFQQGKWQDDQYGTSSVPYLCQY